MLQLKRKLQLGFERVGGTNLRVVGSDMETAISPDGTLRFDFSRLEWREDGMNHGRPAFLAFERPVESREKKAAEQGVMPAASTPSLPPWAYAAIGMALGVGCTVAIMRSKGV
jgi:hypothetical protein